jgi:anti-sigma factor RsiW
MDCNDALHLIDADLDGELDLVRHLDLAAHLAACPACARQAEAARARRAAVRELTPRFTAPPHLANRIRVALAAEGASVTTGTRAAPRARFWWPAWNVAGLAASLAFAVFAGFTWGNARARANRLHDEAIADHVRSLQADHLTDVASTDRHTVKPWFAGRLDFSPPVIDLAESGFPLIGGRLEHIDGRTAAALVFRHRQHVVNLFIWPAEPVRGRHSSQAGYHAESWSAGGFNFLAVSEIPADEIHEFAAAFRAAAP